MSISELYELFIHHPKITTDSRNCPRGSIFFALKGERFDGNQYAEKALATGCSYAVIDNPDYVTGERTILVDNVLTALQQLAHRHRKVLGIPIIGITGTNGKTTTKELLAAVLSTKFNLLYTEGNLNNHIGVPLTLLRLTHDHEMAVIEMGASHPGDIKELVEIVLPNYGIITNVGRAHLEGFGSYENIIATKKALYDYLLPKNGPVFVNTGDPLLMQLSRDHKRYTYGQEGDLLKGEIKQTVPYLVYSLKTRKGDLYVKTHLVGGYNFDNAMAASAIGMHFGIDPLDIQTAIENYRPSNLRSQLIRSGRNTIILDAYNANPSSMRASVGNFCEMPGEHKVVILGEMLELGTENAAAHEEIVRLTQQGNFDRIFLIGNNFEHCADKCNFITWFKDTESFMEYLKSHPLNDSFIFIKGSRGNKLERIVEYL